MPKTTIAETILRQKYKWRIPVFNADADTVGEIFESIEERDGVLSPSAVVDEARPEVSPIHACFEWDDEKAAEKYRETQASNMIRCLIVSTEHIENAPEGPIRAFVHVSGESDYIGLSRALSDEEKSASLLADAARDIDRFTTKYRALASYSESLNSLLNVMEETKNELILVGKGA